MVADMSMAVLVLDLETALFNPTHARCLTGVHPAVLEIPITTIVQSEV
jgi:hypothetical protein